MLFVEAVDNSGETVIYHNQSLDSHQYCCISCSMLVFCVEATRTVSGSSYTQISRPTYILESIREILKLGVFKAETT